MSELFRAQAPNNNGNAPSLQATATDVKKSLERLILEKNRHKTSLDTTDTSGSYTDGADDAPSIQEMEILSQIQELQRQLWQLQTVDESEDESAEPVAHPSSHRLVMVSNRLPVSLKRNEATGEWDFKMSSGGLVTALSGMRDGTPFIWVGWLGCEIPEDEQDDIRKTLRERYNLEPVFLTDELAELYYNGFSNDVLWPLFHYEPLPSFKQGNERKFEQDMWKAYKQANSLFADAVEAIYEPGDLIWVHDYHLMVLPKMLRQRMPSSRVGWFLHIPFPSSEVYRILPVRKSVLEGVLSADLVGFHTYDYARHFLSTCTRLLGLESSPRGVEFYGHYTSIGVFPIGIDPDHFLDISSRPSTTRRIQQLAQSFEGKKVIIGVDRLDYIKGMPHKLLAMEMLLKRYPEWVKNVVLVQIAVPSRSKVEEYRKLCSQVNELVGRINGRYGTLDYAPIHYINQSVKPEELCALYNISDVAMVTSVRDGMNLVSHEYVVCQSIDCQKRDGPGVLVLSEFAGSAQSLSGALRVNPWNVEEVCNALNQALTLTRVERELRHTKLFRYITSHTASFWANSFLGELRATIGRSANVNNLPKLPIRKVMEEYQTSKNRLIVFDFDGTLVQLEAVPQLVNLTPALKSSLNILARDPKNTIILVSGRQQEVMEELLGNLRGGLAAEHGFVYRLNRNGVWFKLSDHQVDDSWKAVTLPVMAYFTERTPGSFVERKHLSLTWHYQDSDPDFGAWQAKDLQIHLEDVVSDYPLEVQQNGKTVEVKHVLANKGKIVDRMLQHMSSEGKVCDFVFCAGDDRSDEDMFKAVEYAHETAKQRDETLSPKQAVSGNEGAPSSSSPVTTLDADVSAAQRVPPIVADIKLPPQVPRLSSSGSSATPAPAGCQSPTHHQQVDSHPEPLSSPVKPVAFNVGGSQRLEDIDTYPSALQDGVMFADAGVFTCHIGRGRSQARYFVEDFKIMRQLVHSFGDISKRQIGISFTKKTVRAIRKNNVDQSRYVGSGGEDGHHRVGLKKSDLISAPPTTSSKSSLLGGAIAETRATFDRVGVKKATAKKVNLDV